MDRVAPEPADAPQAQALLDRLVDLPINKSLHEALNRSSMTSAQMYALLGVVQQVVRMGVPLSSTIFRKSRTLARTLLKNKRFWSAEGGDAARFTMQAMETWLAAQLPKNGQGRTRVAAADFASPLRDAPPKS